MTPSHCFESTRDSKIKVEEKGKKVIISNEMKETYTKIKLDGCLLQHITASDWAISKKELGDLVIELKGCDVDHAVDQIKASILFLDTHNLRNGKLACLIVCKRYPRIDTKIQRAKMEIASKYKAPLHITTENKEYAFSNLFKFRNNT